MRTLAGVRREDWVWAVVAFLGVYTILFTTFFTNPKGVYGLYTGLDYWLGQHDVGRGGEPAYFYAVVLFAHEWPVLLLGAVGTVVAFRRPTLLRVFLVWAFVLSLAVYSWAGEKFAWLVLHPLMPLILLAGLGIQAIWESRRRWFGALGVGVTLAALAYTGYASFLVNAKHSADPREFLVSTQSSTDTTGVRDEVLALAAKRPQLSITIDAAEGATFPWAWYFRHLNVGYLDLSQGTAAPPQTDVLILTQASQARLARPADRLRRARVPLPGLVGARLRRHDPGAVGALVRPPNAVEPDGRDARVDLRPARGQGRLNAWRSIRLIAQIVVPCRSYTRRPSSSHLARPSSPWSVRSIGPKTT